MSAMAAPYHPTIGLEIHAELKTRTKMFCSSKNDPEEKRPNANTCPVCLAHPGTLPVANKEAVRHVLRVGAALGARLADYTEFDRKSYFYPDIPKGYQISQYEHPLVAGGSLNGISITRVHLEEDTARSSHEGNVSVVDFNRAGVPLMELVTEPVIHDAQTAGDFARELQLLLRTLGASDANLEKGEMRIEANISVSKSGTSSPDYVEVKNINSFRSVERAIAYEIDRQITVLEKGERVVKATRGWDEERQETYHQRFKEGSADYRYFPEPDLPKLVLSEIPEFSADTLKSSLPELPWEKRERYATQFSLKNADAEFITADPARGAFIDVVLASVSSRGAELAVNYFVSDLAGDPGKITPETFAEVMKAIEDGALSSRGAKDALAILKEKGGVLADVAVMQVSDTAVLETAVRQVIAEHQKVADEYRGGKEASLQYLVGMAMRATKGAGNPGLIRELLIKQLAA